MPLKDKIKSILHHKKTPSTTTNSSSSTGAPTAAKPNPPNVRDPGFRKSFNLGEREPQEDESPRETASVPIPEPQNTQNAVTDGKDKMYTLDKYGEDYLAVSPRTNATVPETTSTNRGLSTVSTLDEQAMAPLNTIQEGKRNDPVTGAAKKLDELSTSQQNPDYGRDHFAQRERKDHGFIEPVPTRDPAVTDSSPRPEHPTSFVPEALPSNFDSSGSQILASASSGPLGAQPTSLSHQKHPVDDTASSIYNDDTTGRSGNAYNQARSPPLEPSSTAPKATAHQQQYSSLVSDVLPDAESPQPKEPSTYNDPKGGDFFTAVKSNFPDSSKAGEITPYTIPANDTWSPAVDSDLGKINASTPHWEKDKNLAAAGMSTTAVVADSNLGVTDGELAPPITTRAKSSTSIDREAEAVAEILMSNFESLKTTAASPEARDLHDNIPDVQSPEEKPIVTSTNTVSHADAAEIGDAKSNRGEASVEGTEPVSERPPMKPLHSVLEVTKAMPGTF